MKKKTTVRICSYKCCKKVIMFRLKLYFKNIKTCIEVKRYEQELH